MSKASLEKAYAYAATLQRQAAKLPRLIRRSELRLVVPLSDTTIWEMEQRSEFPKRFYLTAHTPVWDLAEVAGRPQQQA